MVGDSFDGAASSATVDGSTDGAASSATGNGFSDGSSTTEGRLSDGLASSATEGRLSDGVASNAMGTHVESVSAHNVAESDGYYVYFDKLRLACRASIGKDKQDGVYGGFGVAEKEEEEEGKEEGKIEDILEFGDEKRRYVKIGGCNYKEHRRE